MIYNKIKNLQFIILLAICINKNLDNKLNFTSRYEPNDLNDFLNRSINILKNPNFSFFHYANEDEKIKNNIENLKSKEIMDYIKTNIIIKDYSKLNNLIENHNLFLIDPFVLYYPDEETGYNYFDMQNNYQFFNNKIPNFNEKKDVYSEFMKKYNDSEYKNYLPKRLLFDKNNYNMYILSINMNKIVKVFYEYKNKSEINEEKENLINGLLSFTLKINELEQ